MCGFAFGGGVAADSPEEGGVGGGDLGRGAEKVEHFDFFLLGEGGGFVFAEEIAETGVRGGGETFEL